MTTQKEIAAAIRGYNLIEEAATETAERWLKIFGAGRESISNMEVDCWEDNGIENGTIDISTETYYCGCCGPDHDSHSLPLSYIWDKDWEKREKEKIAEKKRKETERKAKEKIAADKKRADKRYADYLKMKEEYEV